MADNGGFTALSHAAMTGRCTAASYLLSVGGNDAAMRAGTGSSTLAVAVLQGHAPMVRLLLDKGMDAVGGTDAILNSFGFAIEGGHAIILHMLLDAHSRGSANDVTWVQVIGKVRDQPVLHVAVASGSLATIHVLLAAGADDTSLNPDGKRASDVIGQSAEGDPDPAQEAAIARILERGPAFRARSWTWLARGNPRTDGTLLQKHGP